MRLSVAMLAGATIGIMFPSIFVEVAWPAYLDEGEIMDNRQWMWLGAPIGAAGGVILAAWRGDRRVSGIISAIAKWVLINVAATVLPAIIVSFLIPSKDRGSFTIQVLIFIVPVAIALGIALGVYVAKRENRAGRECPAEQP